MIDDLSRRQAKFVWADIYDTFDWTQTAQGDGFWFNMAHAFNLLAEGCSEEDFNSHIHQAVEAYRA